MIPSGLVLVVLALAAYRACRLTGWDDFPPVAWVRAKITGEKIVSTGSFNARHNLTDEPLESTYSYRWPTLAHFLHCAFCSGFYWSVAFYLAWLEWPRYTMYVAVPAALSALVGLIAKNWDP